MGTYLSSPLVTKEVSSGGVDSLGLRWALCSMQGWRVSMEDAHLVLYARRQAVNSPRVYSESACEGPLEGATSRSLSSGVNECGNGGASLLTVMEGCAGGGDDSSVRERVQLPLTSSTPCMPSSHASGNPENCKDSPCSDGLDPSLLGTSSVHSASSSSHPPKAESYVFVPVETCSSVLTRKPYSRLSPNPAEAPERHVAPTAVIQVASEKSSLKSVEELVASEETHGNASDAPLPSFLNASSSALPATGAFPLENKKTYRAGRGKLRQFALRRKVSPSSAPTKESQSQSSLSEGRPIPLSAEPPQREAVNTEGSNLEASTSSSSSSSSSAGVTASWVEASALSTSQVTRSRGSLDVNVGEGGSHHDASDILSQEAISLSIFAVFDGHGGAHVSRFVAFHFQELLEQHPAFHKGDLATALRAVYLQVDDLLRQESAQEDLLFLSTHTPAQLLQHKRQQQLRRALSASPKTRPSRRGVGGNATMEEGGGASSGGQFHPSVSTRSGLRAQLSNFLRPQCSASVTPTETPSSSDPSADQPTQPSLPADSTEAPQTNAALRRSRQTSSREQDLKSSDGKETHEASALSEAANCKALEGEKEEGEEEEENGQEEEEKGREEEEKGQEGEGGEAVPSGVLTRKPKRGMVASVLDILVRAVTFGRGFSSRSSSGDASHGGTAGGMAVRSLARAAGCTALTVCVTEDSVVVANVGDSRCVLCRAGEALELSQDHKPQLAEERIRIYAAGGYLEMGRVNGNLNLSRALGDLVYKSDSSRPPERQIVSSVPDVLTLKRNKEADEFLIIGCDGIWEALTSAQVAAFVRTRIGKDDLGQILKDLFDLLISPNPAIYELGCDNMTAFLVDLRATDRHSSLSPAVSSVRLSAVS